MARHCQVTVCRWQGVALDRGSRRRLAERCSVLGKEGLLKHRPPLAMPCHGPAVAWQGNAKQGRSAPRHSVAIGDWLVGTALPCVTGALAVHCHGAARP